MPDTILIEQPNVVIISGLLTIYSKRVRDLLNLKVFVDVDSDTRLSRLVVRDTTTRYKKPVETVLNGYLKFVKPSFEEFILPSKKFADVVIPRGDANLVAIDLLSSHLNDILNEKK